MGQMWWIFIVLMMAVATRAVNKHQLPLGAVFRDPDTPAHVGFKYALQVHNANQESSFRISHQVKPVAETKDAYTFLSGVCAMMRAGIFTLVGENADDLNNLVLSNSEFYNLPYITIGHHREQRQEVGEYLLRMRPSYLTGIMELISWLKWRRFFYLYNTDMGIYRFSRLINDLRRRGVSLYPDIIYVEYPDNVTQLNDLLNIYGERMKIDVLLDFPTLLETQNVIDKMSSMGLSGTHFHVIALGLDTKSLRVQESVEAGTTFTGFHLVDDDLKHVKDFYDWWESLDPAKWPGAGIRTMHSDAAMAYDAVGVFTRSVEGILTAEPDAFRSNFRRGEMYNNEQQGMTCSVPGQTWEKGPLLLSAYKQVAFNGLSGHVAFDQRGFRRNYQMNIVMITQNKHWWKIGRWSDTDGLTIVDQNLKVVEREFKKVPTEAMKASPEDQPSNAQSKSRTPAKRLDYSAQCNSGATSWPSAITKLVISEMTLVYLCVRAMVGVRAT